MGNVFICALDEDEAKEAISDREGSPEDRDVNDGKVWPVSEGGDSAKDDVVVIDGVLKMKPLLSVRGQIFVAQDRFEPSIAHTFHTQRKKRDQITHVSPAPSFHRESVRDRGKKIFISCADHRRERV